MNSNQTFLLNMLILFPGDPVHFEQDTQVFQLRRRFSQEGHERPFRGYPIIHFPGKDFQKLPRRIILQPSEQVHKFPRQFVLEPLEIRTP